jgi:chaperonin GroEL
MRKKILFGAEARKSILVGVNAIADAVSVTLGANGRCVLIGESFVQDYNVYDLPTRVTKDGISVARQVKLDDPIENRGVLLMREASQKTMEQAGDGTTTSIVLARSFVVEGMKLLDEGVNPMEIKKGIDEGVEQIVEYLKKTAIPVGDNIEKIRQIATVSSNNDIEIGNLIAEAFEKIGKDGAIECDEATGAKTTVKVSDGFKIDRGFVIPVFINNKTRNKCELVEPYILLYDKNISTMKQLQKIVEQVAAEGKPLLVICEDMDTQALSFLAVNAQQGKFSSCVVKSPYFGDLKRQTMEDIATVTGATIVSDLKGVDIERAKISHLGKASKVVVTKDETVIIGGNKNAEEFEGLINELKMDIVDENDEALKEAIEKRIARLTGGVAVISVGGVTEIEMKERKDRIDDAIKATKAAVSEGIIVGGGTAFLKSGLVIKQESNLRIVSALLDTVKESPLKQLCYNSGVEFEPIRKKILENDEINVGYNAKTLKVEDLMIAGIIDPVKVLRNAILNAASVATSLLTTECIIVDQQ